ncbi:hypothetical protein EPUL_001735 [Erysiphe pulchra]|uniref:SSD domain-containing protein n=1 Tax=Erysiphe pulchra TaxID=225359 RepID=A0A2S4PXG7_9PEZI|nr:hypothetical protein EPUL_001735 [Erysiphe pulchra]
MKSLWCLAAIAALASVALGKQFTEKHEAGRCAIRGNCGGGGFFSPPSPCVDNELAKTPSSNFRSKLVELCGPKWGTGSVCCERDQIQTLSQNLDKAKSFISTCPACKENFYNLFCTFTCSPDQSLFLNVTDAESNGSKYRVTQLDQLITKEYGSGLFDSCKNVKFGPTNTNAMDFIGGGASNYTELLKSLGKKNPTFGSPFQINFPEPNKYFERDMKPLPMAPKNCNDEDENFRCACVDCPSICPALTEIPHSKSCHVGRLPCLSFSAIISYCILISILVITVFGYRTWKILAQRKAERLRLLQDTISSDDEDDAYEIHDRYMYNYLQKTYWLNTICDGAFSRLGYTAAKFPGITTIISVVIIGVLSLGWIKFDVEQDPARLWVSPTSLAAEEKAFFDKSFGPFYRTEQIFLVNDSGSDVPGPVLSYDTLKWWIDAERRISKVKGKKFGSSLDDVCFKPIGKGCVVQSISAYFENNLKAWNPSNWEERLRECVSSPVSCLPEFGQPIDPKLILGRNQSQNNDPVNTSAIITTWVVNNYPQGSLDTEKAMDWEGSLRLILLDLQKEASSRGLRLSFSTEISLEQELNKSTNTDARIIVLSYIAMFIYASLALGSPTLSLKSLITNPANSLVEMKFTIGIVGILIVLMSISASVGLFSMAGIKVTLIIAEVIPFIVLAVGVDNIFLIVHEFERVNISHADAQVEDRISRALGRIGPSILFSAITETVIFSLGAFVGMPAVKNFAIYAAGAVFINAILQITMFVSILALNQRRAEDHRADCFPCIRIKNAGIQLRNSHDLSNVSSRPFDCQDESLLLQFIRKIYTPSILKKRAKVAIIFGFLGIFCAGISLIPEVSLGLDQRDALPSDSYLVPYFSDIYKYFDSGPPVYFVTRKLDVTKRLHQQQLCSRFTTCEQQSLTNILEQERKRSDISYIASTTASWIDDYFRWLDPNLESCCVESGKTCFKNRQPPWNITLSGMPESDEFLYYLHKWMAAPTDENCPLGGKAAYGSSIVIDTDKKTILASQFRTSHTPLRSQKDFIEAYASSRRVAELISKENNIKVFPYSVFYIFFDQYSTIVKLSTTLLGSAFALIFLISSILLGSFQTAFIVTFTVVMIVVDIVGTMAVFKISLNAISLVNLIICVGIGVEFCAHIARAFMFPSRSIIEQAQNKFRGRDARAWTALVGVGGSVFSGITVTKLLGVTVLAFTRSKIFDIYYFRIWLALVIFAGTHALIFLPVALSLFGGNGYGDSENVGGLEEDLANRRYRALIPDVDDSDDEN